MSTNTNTAYPAPDEFADLLRELLVILCEFKAADAVFWQVANLTGKAVAASVVTQDATSRLDALYDELDSWHAHHVHTAKG